MALWTFMADYDPEARIWWTSNDALGIATEGDSLERLAAKLDVMVPEMVEENARFLTEDERREPHEFRLIAHYGLQRQAPPDGRWVRQTTARIAARTWLGIAAAGARRS